MNWLWISANEHKIIRAVRIHAVEKWVSWCYKSASQENGQVEPSKALIFACLQSGDGINLKCESNNL